MVVILLLVYVVYHTDIFEDIEKSLQPSDKSHLIKVYSSFNASLDSFCYYFVEDFFPCSSLTLSYNFLSLSLCLSCSLWVCVCVWVGGWVGVCVCVCDSLVWFSCHCDALGRIPSSEIYWNSFRQIGVNASINV